MRIIRTLKAIEQTDIALLLCEDEAHERGKEVDEAIGGKKHPCHLATEQG